MPYYYYGYGYSSDYALQYLLMFAALILGLVASAGVRSAYNKYSRIQNRRRVTGAEVAQRILSNNGIFDVKVVATTGHLTDHFDPRSKVIRLSEGVYNGTSIASVAVAAHECGHAIQHNEDYKPIKVRNAILPVANIGSSLALPLVLLGIFLGGFEILTTVGIALFLAVVLFQLVTLPVEFNASRRAMVSMEGLGILDDGELPGARRVLTAAAMTYVASVLSSLLSLMRLLLLSRSRRR